jgi:hypothetical protein
MIGIFDEDGNRLAITYNGLTLNNPADDPDNTYEINTVSPAGLYSTVEDAHQFKDGTEVYDASKDSLVLLIDGTIRAQSLAGLFDKIRALRAAFDAAKVSHENPSTNGFLPLDFSTPTADTTNFATGLVDSRYYARERRLTIPTVSEYTGFSAFFHLDLLIRDPRRYRQTASTSAGGDDITNIGDYRSWPTITITATGAGSATYTYQNVSTIGGTKSIVLTLASLINNDVVVIDMDAQTITKNGNNAPSLFVSGSYFEIEPGSNVITLTNTTNVTTSTSYRTAWCA